MDISRAALPPIQPPILESHRRHPNFKNYERYRSAMSVQLVEALSFDQWQSQLEWQDRDDRIKAHPRFKEFQEWMWATEGGAPGKTTMCFPENFHAWLQGARW